jgi:serine/threonine-protein kinase
MSDSKCIAGFKIIERLSRSKIGDSLFVAQKDGADPVALKVRTGKDAIDAAAIERFQREFFVLSSIASPYVLRAGELIREPELLAFSMEHASSGSLSEKIGACSLEEAIAFITQTAYGVLAIHREGIVHTQLEPKSILFGSDGAIRIGEFGSSVLQDPLTTTHLGSRLGAPEYGSPEYFQNGAVNGQFDIYSLGLIAYELVTGQPAFNTNNPLEKIEIRLARELPSALLVRPDSPVWLSQLIERCTRRNPEERIKNIEQLVALIESKGEEADVVIQKENANFFSRISNAITKIRSSSETKPSTKTGYAFVSGSSSGVYVHRAK